jgi:osmotically-inducible protein OsmY
MFVFICDFFMTIIRFFIICFFFPLFCVSYAPAQSPGGAPASLPSDQFLQGKIQGILDFNDYFNSSDVDVRVKGGAVTLEGVVPSAAERTFAERIASKIGGSSILINNLRINEALVSRSRSDLEQFLSDQSLQAKILSLITCSKILQNTAIEVDVRNEIAYLKGSSLNPQVRLRAAEIAGLVYGVKNVENYIKQEEPQPDPAGLPVLQPVAGPHSDAWISAKVRSYLGYAFALPGNDLFVTTRQGIVELKGQIRDFSQKQKIEEQIRDIEGVTGINNSARTR